jgi:hypothetical protein
MAWARRKRQLPGEFGRIGNIAPNGDGPSWVSTRDLRKSRSSRDRTSTSSRLDAAVRRARLGVRLLLKQINGLEKSGTVLDP